MGRTLITAYFSVLLVIGVLLGTGLVPDWGIWYTVHSTYRIQVEAFLRGEFALSTTPADVAWDLAWTRGGVQQVWGLGAPAWRLPFDSLAKVFGHQAFPDMLAFGAALAAVVFAAFRVFWFVPGGKDPLGDLFRRPEKVCVVIMLALFPPFLALCQTRFSIYEEAAAYSYLAGCGLLVGIRGFVRRPRFGHFLALVGAAGLASFVRPTLLFYGGGTVVVAVAYAWSLGWSKGRLALGMLLFGAGCGLIFWTNVVRFGSGIEFGHSLNLNGIDAMRYATRFGAPFQSEPWWSAMRELLGGLFFSRGNLNGVEWFADGFMPGISSTHRWREFYFTTYDLSFALMMMAGIALWVRSEATAWRDRGRSWEKRVSELKALRVMMVWAAIPAVALFVFYLRAPVASSRYLLDFAPAFAAVMVCFFYQFADSVRKWRGEGWRSGLIIWSVFLLWWGVQLGLQEVSAERAGQRSLSGDRLVTGQLEAAGEGNVSFPESYALGDVIDGGWPAYHLAGWDIESGNTGAAVAVFVSPFEKLVLDVVPKQGVGSDPEAFDMIRAKVGLEFLERLKTEATPEGTRIVFAGPERADYREGVEVCFIAFMSVDELHHGESDFRLLRIDLEGGAP